MEEQAAVSQGIDVVQPEDQAPSEVNVAELLQQRYKELHAFQSKYGVPLTREDDCPCAVEGAIRLGGGAAGIVLEGAKPGTAVKYVLLEDQFCLEESLVEQVLPGYLHSKGVQHLLVPTGCGFAMRPDYLEKLLPAGDLAVIEMKKYTTSLGRNIKRLQRLNRLLRAKCMEYVAGAVLEAVAGMERARYMHLDIKPDNVMLVLSASGKVKAADLSDFGVAVELDAETLTAQAIGGTKGYNAPEKARRRADNPAKWEFLVVGPASESYASAVTLLEAMEVSVLTPALRVLRALLHATVAEEDPATRPRPAHLLRAWELLQAAPATLEGMGQVAAQAAGMELSEASDRASWMWGVVAQEAQTEAAAMCAAPASSSDSADTTACAAAGDKAPALWRPAPTPTGPMSAASSVADLSVYGGGGSNRPLGHMSAASSLADLSIYHSNDSCRPAGAMSAASSLADFSIYSGGGGSAGAEEGGSEGLGVDRSASPSIAGDAHPSTDSSSCVGGSGDVGTSWTDGGADGHAAAAGLGSAPHPPMCAVRGQEERLRAHAAREMRKVFSIPELANIPEEES